MGADMSNLRIGNPVNSFDSIQKAKGEPVDSKAVTNTSKVPDLLISPVLPVLSPISSENSNPITQHDVKALKTDELSTGKVKHVSKIVPRKPLSPLGNNQISNHHHPVAEEVGKKNQLQQENDSI